MWKVRGFLCCATLGSIAALSACSSSGDNIDAITQPGHEAAVEIVSGNHQTAPAGTELSQPLVGRLIDAAGNAVANRPVSFVVTSGEGALATDSALSSASGLVSARWTLGPGAGKQTVDFRGTSPTGAPIVFATFDSTATAGAASSITAIAGTQRQAAMVSTSASVGVSVVDLQGNAKPGVRVWFTPCDTCGSARPASSLTNAGGVATSVWTFGASPGAQDMHANVIGLPDVRFEALATLTAPGAPINVAERNGAGQSVEQHARNAVPLGVFVSDASGAAVPGIPVEFAPAMGSAHFLAQTINTDANGQAAFTGYFHEAGMVRVDAAVAGLPPISFDLHVASVPYDFDGEFTCRLANAPDSLHSMRVQQNSVFSDDYLGQVAADGSFDLTLRSGDTGKRMQGKIQVGIDGDAAATGTRMDSETAIPWSCERL